MTNLKTLKDMCDDDWYEEHDIYNIDANEVVDLTKEEAKAEAVKWVKKDIKDWQKGPLFQSEIIERWKKRFNITESDLEENNGI